MDLLHSASGKGRGISSWAWFPCPPCACYAVNPRNQGKRFGARQIGP